MDLEAPTPSDNHSYQPLHTENPVPEINVNSDSAETRKNAPSVTLIGCGGCGINISRPFHSHKNVNIRLFDTSDANERSGEHVIILGDGHGSGGDRSQNARIIERSIPQLTEVERPLTDVVIIMSSLSGGSGSLISPVLARDYAQRNVRVICVGVADTGYMVAAKNTANTLKTFHAITKNNDIRIPMILVSNDHASTQGQVNEMVTSMVAHLLDVLTVPVEEVDRNDRLNWIDSSKITGADVGIKMMSFTSEKFKANPKIVLGSESADMVDSLLILQSSHDEVIRDPSVPPARLKKVGIYTQPHHRIVARVSSDISDINSIIDLVERQEHAAKSSKTSHIDRLATNTDDDLIL